MELNNENYFSQEANREFCSVSQYKEFIGSPFKPGCEYRALAELDGKYERKKTEALLVGSYVDMLMTEPENLEKFKEENPEMFSSRGATKGLPKSSFLVADRMVERVKKDHNFMTMMQGDHQTIMTADIFGVPFKIKMDTYREHKFISDLKTVESIGKGYYSSADKRYMSFIEYFDYILQGAIYQEVVFKNTGERLPFYICAISKEEITDFDVFQIDNQTLHDALYGNEFGGGIADNLNQIRLLKNGEIEPCRCGKCDWCKINKSVTRIKDYRELMGEI